MTNPDTPSPATAERRCPGCATWYPKKDGDCPECGEPAAQHNKWLRTAALNNHLYKQLETA